MQIEKNIFSGAQIIVQELINQKVNTVFGYPGATVLPLYDELYKNSGIIQNVLTAHEQGACHCADGYARASGKTGVVIATSGPGATNLVTGIATAYMDSVPIVAITGNVSRHLLGKDSFQEVDIIGITMPIVKHSFMVQNIQELSQIIREAFYIAGEGRPGPVLVDIPKDIQTEFCEYDYNEFDLGSKDLPLSNFSVSNLPLSNLLLSKKKTNNNIAQHIVEISELIKSSKRSFIFCGGGVLTAQCSQETLVLSKKLSAPIGTTLMGISGIPSSYRMNLGMTGMHGKYAANTIKDESDLIIAIGVRFSDRTTGNIGAYTASKKIIHIDIDKAEFNKNIKADICLQGDLKNILKEILSALPNICNKEWIQRIDDVKKSEQGLNIYGNEFSPKSIIETVRAHCGNDTLIATDVGQHQMWVAQNYKFENPRTLLTSGGLGTMGYGMGAAIGGCLASGKQTVLFTGDGSFGMNLNELATAVSLNLPLIIIVMNNGVLGMVRQWQTLFYEKRYSNTVLNRKTNFVKLAKAFGAKGYLAENHESLEKILKKSFNCGTVVIECMINPDEKVLPMIPAGASAKDIIVK